jgi:hypothetical protein
MRRHIPILGLTLSLGFGLLVFPGVPVASAAGCLYSYSESNGTPTITGTTGSVVLTTYLTSEANPILKGTLNGKNLTVVLWKGMPEQASKAATDGLQQDWNTLAAASVSGATTGDTSAEVTDAPATSLNLGQMETFAASIHDGSGAVDYTAMEADSVIVDTSTGASGTTCLRGSSSASVTVTSPGSEFNFPQTEAGPGGTVAPAALPTLPNSIIRYRTFIPAATADGGPCGRFRGDNRGYTSYYAAPNRTYVAVVFRWSTKTITTAKAVGATKKVNSSNQVIETATASSAGIKFYSPMMASDYGRIQVNHAVGHPLCSIAGPIAYSLVFEDWKSGGTRIRGTARKVPNHEANVYPISEQYGDVVFRRTVTSFLCLNLNCGDESVNASIK